MKNYAVRLFLVFLICSFSFTTRMTLEGAYILRYSTLDNGGISYTGNTLGLSKKEGLNDPGTNDSIGAFITTEKPLPSPVGTYPNDGTAAGTTLNYTANSSSAILDLPEGSTVLYAELIWSGSFDFFSQITGNQPDGPVTLITPQLTSHQFTADPVTSQNATTPGYGCHESNPTPCHCPCGNYVRSANVTEVIQSSGAGTYTVGGVAGTVASGDETHNAAGWTLAVIYRNPNMFTYNMTLFVGCEQASYTTNSPAEVSGFCVPPSGELNGRLFISATEGDANKSGDHMLFGNHLPLTIAANSLSGVNNPVDNFFASQINTFLPLTTDPVTGKLVAIGSSQLDTRGSYGTFNADPFTVENISGGRQGLDITSIDISNTLSFNQTTAYALGATESGGDDYTISSVAMQIQVGAPIIKATKLVNSQTDIHSFLGATVTFNITLTNTGTAEAFSVLFTDPLQEGLTYVPGSFVLNGTPQSDPNLTTGVNLGDLLINESATLQFQAQLTAPPPEGNIYYNSGSLAYTFLPCQGDEISLQAATNVISIDIGIPPPCCFTGTVDNCYLSVTWGAAPSSFVQFYRIYNGSTLLAAIPATFPLDYMICLCLLEDKSEINELEIVAVYPDGIESSPVPITVGS